MSANGTVCVFDHDANGTWVVALEGEHDISTTPLLEQQTEGVWPRCTRAVVDLSEASFIDCSVINWLLRARSATAAPGHDDFRVVWGESGAYAERVFHLVWLRDELSFYPTRQDAMEPASAELEPAGRRAPPGRLAW